VGFRTRDQDLAPLTINETLVALLKDPTTASGADSERWESNAENERRRSARRSDDTEDSMDRSVQPCTLSGSSGRQVESRGVHSPDLTDSGTATPNSHCGQANRSGATTLACMGGRQRARQEG
jgi:hypothetical protein